MVFLLLVAVGHTLWSVPDICDDSKFPVDASGLQLMGLKKFARSPTLYLLYCLHSTR